MRSETALPATGSADAPSAAPLPRPIRLCGGNYVPAMLSAATVVSTAAALGLACLTFDTLYLSGRGALPIRAVFLSALAAAALGSLGFRLWQARRMHRAWRLDRSRLVAPLWNQAARDAMVFVSRQLRFDIWFVPLMALAAPWLTLFVCRPEARWTLSAAALAMFPAISAFVVCSLFAVEPGVRPILRKLLADGARVDYRSLPTSSLGFRLRLCSSLIIVAVAIVNSLLARERAREMIEAPHRQTATVAKLESQASLVTAAALIAGVLCTTLVSRSVSTRIRSMIEAMDRAGGGLLSERLRPTGNDELDVLAHQFNAMVSRLDGHSRAIRVLNAELERKVQQRTAQLQDKIAELQAMQAKLVHAEKMASLGQLVAGVAHELNNSINAVYNGIQPLRGKLKQLEQLVAPHLAPTTLTLQADDANDDANDDGPAALATAAFARISRLADAIENGASRTARIVSDLKTFSHPGAEHCAAFDLHDVLDMSLNLLSNELRRRITVHKDYGQIGELVGPRSQLSQVFLNIFNNAQQAMCDAGDLYIVTRPAGEQVLVSIRDTGHGIPEEIRDRIFDPFFTTKPPGVGTGLGLSISYGLIAKIGGAIECRSRPGEGAEFVIVLPRVARQCDAVVETGEGPPLAPPESANLFHSPAAV